MNLFTIGFTRKSAEQFFDLLRGAHATTLIDLRLNTISQLAGFAKREDLKFFLSEICGMTYTHRPDLAPTQAMLDEYKKHGAKWAEYEPRFIELIKTCRIEETVPPELVKNAVLLCSEDEPHHCHRRLVAEYLAQHWDDVDITHLVSPA